MKDKIRTIIANSIYLNMKGGFCGYNEAADKIANLFDTELSKHSIIGGSDAEVFFQRRKIPKGEQDRMQANYEQIMKKSEGIR